MINIDVLRLIKTPTENAPTISCFVEEYFSDLVPASDYFTYFVRYDDLESMSTTPTKPEEVLARLSREFTRADAVRVGGESAVDVTRQIVIGCVSSDTPYFFILHTTSHPACQRWP